MAKKPDNDPQHLMRDEKIINSVSDFFTKHLWKLILVFLVVLVFVIVWGVNSHMQQTRSAEAADYCKLVLFDPLEKGEEDVEFDVEKILSTTKGTPTRWRALLTLGQALFNQGGDDKLKQAEQVAAILKQEAIEQEMEDYQIRADQLLTKIKEEEDFELPKFEPLGPEMQPPEDDGKSEEPPLSSVLNVEGAKVVEPKPAESDKPDEADKTADPEKTTEPEKTAEPEKTSEPAKTDAPTQGDEAATKEPVNEKGS